MRTGVEVQAFLTFKFDLFKHKTIELPRIELKDEIMKISNARSLGDAARLAFPELIRCLGEDYVISPYDANMLLSLTAKPRIAQIGEPLFTVVAKFPKDLIKR